MHNIGLRGRQGEGGGPMRREGRREGEEKGRSPRRRGVAQGEGKGKVGVQLKPRLH